MPDAGHWDQAKKQGSSFATQFFGSIKRTVS